MKTYSKDFLTISRSVGSIIAIPFAFFAISDMVSTIKNTEGYFTQNMNYEGLIMTTVIFLFLVGYLISWINTGIGGMLMILSGLVISIPLIIIDRNIGTLIFAIPFIGAGLLYILYWNGKRKLKTSNPQFRSFGLIDHKGKSNKNFPIRPDATTLLEDLRAGKTSSESLVNEHLEQLNKTQPTVNGATKVFKKEGLDQARKLDRSGDKTLPLFGLPCSVKETFAIEGEEVTAGSIRRVPNQCKEDAAMVHRLRRAGAVIIARSNIPEFAMTGETTNLRFGRCNNPLDITRVAGGSSGGEGALVGSGASVFGIGSDILGSIRIPAALCGTVGFKAHSKAIDNSGTWPDIKTSLRGWLGYGPICRSVRDAQLIYNVLAAQQVPETEETFKNLIIPEGFPIKYRQSCIEDAVNVAHKTVLDRGMISLKEDFKDIPSLFLNIPKIILNELYDNWIKDLSSSPKYGHFSPRIEFFRQMIGKSTMDSGLLKWMLLKPFMKSRLPEKREIIANSFIETRIKYQQLLGDDNVMILPTLGLVAPKHGNFNRISLLNPTVNGLFTSHTLGNYLDLSVICIPAWKYRDHKTGLPASISLFCAPGSEGRLFATAKIVEAALN